MTQRKLQSEKMTIFVRSKRVCVASKNVYLSTFQGNHIGSNLSTRAKRVAIYENVLDDEQKEALENSKALANSLGVKLEVRDLARTSVFRKLFDLIGRSRFAPKTPSLSFYGKTIALLASIDQSRT